MESIEIRHPVVLIHGVFGYGRQRPFWQSGPPYWPERALDFMGANYLVVDSEPCRPTTTAPVKPSINSTVDEWTMDKRTLSTLVTIDSVQLLISPCIQIGVLKTQFTSSDTALERLPPSNCINSSVRMHLVLEVTIVGGVCGDVSKDFMTSLTALIEMNGNTLMAR
ncbi:hypothetical protein Poli38472_007046 [Pythium oligandrum]|uniref:Uncharacterized protein n=1 Tax=Pythium oligandrum TaxID=41045 RepID=A0A8K1C9K6_PYTOL|nr:hypothetical protein Poli38472_007046 [Pythium oligandrum]|eukprot:TMW58901.1 hypothetical protein Poli38472_007046 [Pythium oligandrum]